MGREKVLVQDEHYSNRLMTPGPLDKIDETLNLSLRPPSLNEYIGQNELREKIRISIDAAKNRGEPLEHMLFYGPPGLGKTTLAHIIANEMKTKVYVSSGPALPRPGDLVGILTSLNGGDVLFIDEIHRLPTVVEEYIYPAMEDFRVDFVLEKGVMARTMNLPLKRFTLIGATTRAGSLSGALRNRFGMFHMVDFYPVEDLEKIIQRSAILLRTVIEPEAVREIACRSRGTPRIANRLLRRVRDYAQVKSDGVITAELSRAALSMEGIDDLGLDELDRKYLRVIIDHYKGGPVGIETIGATLNEECDTLEDMVEPFLMKIGFIQRTSRGRKVTGKTCRHLGLKPNVLSQERLF